ncbi:MAG: four-carbon acid sugar kinase family protein [Rhizobiales bacterium]|nr:four-carbon acid sugar kinase family protein [Hyphomicrobiales bacterium]
MSVPRPLVGFYGDDFTGSSENLAQFHRHGLKARLYIKIPAPEAFAAAAAELDVVGIAGTARALSPDAMETELSPAFAALAGLGPQLVQYKICSTFDSAPATGSFGKVIEVAGRHFPGCVFPVLAASPDFGRYTAFGCHFARFGDRVERLDRHPSMATHPKTPMHEADLARHLALQTAHPFGHAMLPDLRAGRAFEVAVEAFAAGRGVIFDTVDNTDLAAVAEAVWTASARWPVVALAAQGLAQALGAILAADRTGGARPSPATLIPAADRLLVLSGSCALQNARQIDVAEQAGWLTVHLDPARLGDSSARGRAFDEIGRQVPEALAAGRPVIVYTARGSAGRMTDDGGIPADRLGAVYADLAGLVRSKTRLDRLVLAGGDSSSFTVRALDAASMEIAVFDAAQGSHVIRLGGGAAEGLEVMLKGGQIGADDYFLRAHGGTR